MYHKTGLILLLGAAVLNIAAGKPAHAACSLASVAGAYGYTTTGFVAVPNTPGAFVPAAAAGRIYFDGLGHVTGTQTRVVAGAALDETFSGTYSVNGNCKGSFTVQVQPDTRTSTVNVVWTDNTNAISAVFTNPGFVLTAVAHRINLRDED
jgi:hypothetical protein